MTGLIVGLSMDLTTAVSPIYTALYAAAGLTAGAVKMCIRDSVGNGDPEIVGDVAAGAEAPLGERAGVDVVFREYRQTGEAVQQFADGKVGDAGKRRIPPDAGLRVAQARHGNALSLIHI